MLKVTKIIPHVCLIFSGTFITFYILDKFNEEMAFINNGASKLMLFFFCLISIVVSLMLIVRQRKEG